MSKRSRDSPDDEKFDFTDSHFLIIVCLAFLIALLIAVVKVNIQTDLDPFIKRIEAIEQRLDAERR